MNKKYRIKKVVYSDEEIRYYPQVNHPFGLGYYWGWSYCKSNTNLVYIIKNINDGLYFPSKEHAMVYINDYCSPIKEKTIIRETFISMDGQEYKKLYQKNK